MTFDSKSTKHRFLFGNSKKKGHELLEYSPTCPGIYLRLKGNGIIVSAFRILTSFLSVGLSRQNRLDYVQPTPKWRFLTNKGHTTFGTRLLQDYRYLSGSDHGLFGWKGSSLTSTPHPKYSPPDSPHRYKKSGRYSGRKE